MPPEVKQTAEESFKAALEDAVEIITTLSPYCNSFDEMIEMIQLAVKNEAQLRLLLKESTKKK